MTADELAAALASVDSYLCLSARSEHRDLADRLRAHIDALTAERDRWRERWGKASLRIGEANAQSVRLTAERDAARAEAAALREHPKAYQIDGGSVHTVITTAQYEALRRVVDADIEVEDTNEAITQVANQGLPAPELAWQRLDAAYETRREALAVYRAEWSR